MSTETASGPANATDADFQQTVLDASLEVPVLVDFWAPWCEPCKVIGPLLEKLEAEAAGKFRLVKVNVDENPMLAQAFQIRSIPTVKLVADGELRDEFTGALPEPEIRKFLEKNLPASPEPEGVSALQLYLEGHREQALRIFQETLAENPEDTVALIGVGNCSMDGGDLEQARTVLAKLAGADLDGLEEKALAQKAMAGLQAKVFLTETLDGGAGQGLPAETETPETLGARFGMACRQALQGDYEEALEGLIAIVQEDRKFKDDGGRKAMLAVFDLIPADSPLANPYRARLSSLLFS